MTERNKLYQEICNLEAELSSANSPIGDWKIVKSYEYNLLGIEAPYDINELHKERQIIRDKINEIQAKLGLLEDK